MSYETRVRRAARAALYGGLERIWSAGLQLAALAAPCNARSWQARGIDRVLVVAPHPDDETAGAGGVVRLHIEAGDTVTVVVVTDGSGSGALPVAPEEMALLRGRELRQAMRVLGVEDSVQLGLDERTWRDGDALNALAPYVGAADIVYSPGCVDYHPHHLRVARIVGTLVRAGQAVRVMELGVPLTPRLINLVADVTGVRDVKQRALDAFATQRWALLPLRRLERYRSRRLRRSAAEAFWELEGAAFARVMAATAQPDGPVFRGVRVRPFSDPLCWLAGTGERRRLRRLARTQP